MFSMTKVGRVPFRNWPGRHWGATVSQIGDEMSRPASPQSLIALAVSLNNNRTQLANSRCRSIASRVRWP